MVHSEAGKAHHADHRQGWHDQILLDHFQVEGEGNEVARAMPSGAKIPAVDHKMKRISESNLNDEEKKIEIAIKITIFYGCNYHHQNLLLFHSSLHSGLLL